MIILKKLKVSAENMVNHDFVDIISLNNVGLLSKKPSKTENTSIDIFLVYSAEKSNLYIEKRPNEAFVYSNRLNNT